MKIGELTGNEAFESLINNDLNWYIVEYIDGSFDLKHSTALSSILECGHDPKNYDINEIYQCWNGKELGECPWSIDND